MDEMLQPKDTDWLNGYKNKTHIYAIYKTHFRPQDTYRLKVRGWKNIFHANGKQKKDGVAILISSSVIPFSSCLQSFLASGSGCIDIYNCYAFLLD